MKEKSDKSTNMATMKYQQQKEAKKTKKEQKEKDYQKWAEDNPKLLVQCRPTESPLSSSSGFLPVTLIWQTDGSGEKTRVWRPSADTSSDRYRNNTGVYLYDKKGALGKNNGHFFFYKDKLGNGAHLIDVTNDDTFDVLIIENKNEETILTI
jgi:hypothetical protein